MIFGRVWCELCQRDIQCGTVAPRSAWLRHLKTKKHRDLGNSDNDKPSMPEVASRGNDVQGNQLEDEGQYVVIEAESEKVVP